MDILVTGSSGLIGSEAVGISPRGRTPDRRCRQQHACGLFRPQGDTSWRALPGAKRPGAAFRHHEPDIRDRATNSSCSRDRGSRRSSIAPRSPRTIWPKARPFDDFEVNAVGTLNLLEAARRHSPDAVRPHEHQQGLRRRPTNWRSSSSRPARTMPTRPNRGSTKPADRPGMHSLFGASRWPLTS